MSSKQRKNLIRIIISAILFIVVTGTNVVLTTFFGDIFPNGLASIIPGQLGFLLPLFLYLAIYIYIGYDVLRKCFFNIINGQIFDENFLMTIATIGAFSLGIYLGIKEGNPEGFDEGVAVLLFYQVGEWFQKYAVNKSRKSISDLMDIRPDTANIKLKDGTLKLVDPSSIKIGDIIVVKPGEKVPLDGIIVSGSSSLDTKTLTGESLPKDVSVNEEVISGSINLTSLIEVKVTKDYSNSTVSKILELVENASNKKSKSENFITKFSKYYTPIVCALALSFAVIPLLVCGLMNLTVDGLTGWNTFSIWLYRSLSFLVVSCPCALVISIPLSFFSGIGKASRHGILVKGSIHLENLAKANIFVFDKTGTLTKGNFHIKDVYPSEKRDEILSYASSLEYKSNHPIAKSILNEYKGEIDKDYELKDVSGKGIIGTNKKTTIMCGNKKLMEDNNIICPEISEVGTIIYVAKNNNLVGYIIIEDEIKTESYETIKYLNSLGAKTIMLTGDNELIARNVASKLNMKEFKASLLPQDKVLEVNNLLNDKNENDLLCFIGDGINDAPSLVSSDIGISMGALGSDAAIEASDIVLMNDNLNNIKLAKKISKKTLNIVKQNIIFAISIKVIILILSAFGITNMWLAVIGDVGVAILAILNSMRINTK